MVGDNPATPVGEHEGIDGYIVGDAIVLVASVNTLVVENCPEEDIITAAAEEGDDSSR